MILRSTVSPDEILSGSNIRNRLWERFGIIVGGSTYELERLQSSGMLLQIDEDSLERNFTFFAALLESMDFAEGDGRWYSADSFRRFRLMMDKQSLVIGLLLERMADSKVGILARGISDIQPTEIAIALSIERKSHIYIAAVDMTFLQRLKKQSIL